MVDEPGVTRDHLYGQAYWREHEFMIVDPSGVITISKSQATVMEKLAISTTIGMDGIPLAIREAVVAIMPSMIKRQATTAVEESSVIIFWSMVRTEQQSEGTTHDAIDTEFTKPDRSSYLLILRTAIASAGSTTEALLVNRAFHAIRRSDVVALVIEAMSYITEQLEAFTSFNAPDFYGLPRNKLNIKLRKAPWKVPDYFSFQNCSVYDGETLE
ncbi:hypothetical protein VNO78_01284 [Psophocarpus tetragonolobus]|uniref:Uncharacterized protein n=1 Tax=Psophocarpus tetragonolobus TaxID=3891 RepID=A0AAN9SY74_PSOTE